MTQWWKPIRDKLQRTLFNQQLSVLRVLAKNGGPMTYGEVSFAANGKVSTDNALTVLYEMRDSMEPPLVDFSIRRGGVTESFFAINAAGREYLKNN